MVYLCSGRPSECGIDTDISGCGDGSWWVMVVNPGGKELYRCSVARNMGTLDIPATLRWRWFLEDEGMWMRCPPGCCDMSPF